jgi:hypothetical protein
MRIVTWTDSKGFKHRSSVRNTDPDNMAEMGVRQDPPDFHRIDWEDVIRDLHNACAEQGIVTWQEYQRHDMRGIILGAIQRRIQTLFREVENG